MIFSDEVTQSSTAEAPEPEALDGGTAEPQPRARALSPPAPGPVFPGTATPPPGGSDPLPPGPPSPGTVYLEATAPEDVSARATPPPPGGLGSRKLAGDLCCSQCNYSTNSRGKFDEHVKAHKGRFVCKLCAKAFIKVRRHVISHVSKRFG